MSLFFLTFGLEEKKRAVMIIPSALIKLDYNPAKDVLSVEWPDVQSYALDKVRFTLKEVIDTVRYYDVKRLLIDSRQTVIGVSKESYATLASDFSKQILATRLEKVARIESDNTDRETQVHEMISNVSAAAVAFRSFSDITAATAWLETGY